MFMPMTPVSNVGENIVARVMILVGGSLLKCVSSVTFLNSWFTLKTTVRPPPFYVLAL